MLWLIVLLAAPDVSAVANPRARGGWVSDGAHMIDAASEQAIERRCQQLHERIDLEIAVVTVDTAGPDPRAFALELFNHWGVGDATSENGLLILLARRERALETITGDGLDDVITDAWIQRTQDAVAVPAFKRGDFGGGIDALIGAVETFLSTSAPGEGAPHGGGVTPGAGPGGAPTASTAVGPPPPPPPRDPDTIDKPDDDGDNTMLGLGLGLGVLGVGGLGAFGAVRYRKWERTCPTCKIDMTLLDEAADDAHLDPGQRSEERLGSLDHRVFWCGQCSNAVLRRPKGRWFSGYRRCRQCRYKTMTRSSTTVSAATYDSSGSMRIDEDCGHCSYSNTSYRSIPRLQRPSESSSSSYGGSSGGSSYGGGSGGSFGGGSSSGGGGSSSW